MSNVLEQIFICQEFVGLSIFFIENNTKKTLNEALLFVLDCKFKVVGSCWISSTEWSDSFRSFFCIWEGARIMKKYIT